MATSLRSLAAGGRDRAQDVAQAAYPRFAANFPQKLYWFLTKGYRPHEWQAAFHAADTSGSLTRFRHLVAGRRGGKTMSAAWEVLFYCLHPEIFHQDAHGAESSRPLWVWVLTKDHEVGRPARMAFRDALREAGLVDGKDYRWNKTENTVDFENGSFLQFRTAVDPDSLVGAGLDIMWIDEAAKIRDNHAYEIARPALSDKLGLVITTTTPKGKNWYYDEFFTGAALKLPEEFRVEYTSIDNPYFPKTEWGTVKARMHPAMFAQEFVASFDAMSGIALDGQWLHYYTAGKAEPENDLVELPKGEDGKVRLRRYLGIDPSTGESEDAFAIACVGVAEDFSQAYLLDYFTGKIQFPDQIDKIREWQLRYRPELIGIESNAYQRVLAQQTARLSGFPGVVPVISKGKKADRIISMSPLFKIGKVRIHRRHVEFIDQWVSYDPSVRDQKDDLLDSVEIAIGVAGVLLPMMELPVESKGPRSLGEEARLQIAGLKDRAPYDHELGTEV